MSDEYQLRGVDRDGRPFGLWFDVAGRKNFYTPGNHVLIRKKPVPRGAGWYQNTDVRIVKNRDILYFNSDPGDDYRKMKEPQEDQA